MSLKTAALLALAAGLWTGALPLASDTEGREREEPLETSIEEKVEVRAVLPEGDDVAAFSTTIDGEDLTRRGEDLADVLRRVPGAHVRDYGGFGSYANVSVRASTAQQVTVLVDGLPQNRALGGPVDLSSIPATQIEQVTVFRGFGPAAYGLGGIGGVVDVRTRKAGPEPRFQLDALAGQFNTQRLSGDLSLSTGKESALRIGVEGLRSDGDFLYTNSNATFHTRADDTVAIRQNNRLNHASALLQQTWNEVGNGQLTLGLRAQGRERGVPGVANFQSTTARTKDDLVDLTTSWSRGYRGPVRSLDLRLNGFRQGIDFEDLDGDLGRPTDRETQMWGAGVDTLTRLRVGSHQLLLRMDLRREEARVSDEVRPTPDRGGAGRTLLAATVEDLVSTGGLTIAPSVRWEYRHDSFLPGDAGTIGGVADDVRAGNWAGKLGLAYRFGPHTVLRGSAGHFFRAPSFLELFGDRGAVTGNPLLRPESGDAAELGVAWDRPRERTGAKLELVAFARRTEDLIQFIQNSQGVSTPQNIARSEVVGVEGSVGASWNWGLSLDASGTYQDATDTSEGFPNGNPLPYTPRELGYLGVAYQKRGFRTVWDMTYVGESSIDQLDTPERRIPERIIHDMLLSYAWPSGMRVGMDLRNVFDRQTRDLSRYPLPNRMLLFHVGWSSDGGP